VPFDPPALTLPIFADPTLERRRGWLRFPRALILGALSGGVAYAVSAPWAALAVAVIVAVGLIFPWARVAATLGGLGFIVAGCVEVVHGQSVHHYFPGSNWAGSFVHAGDLIWVGIVLLLADAVITSFGLRVPKPLPPGRLRPGPPGSGAGVVAAPDEPEAPMEDAEPGEVSGDAAGAADAADAPDAEPEPEPEQEPDVAEPTEDEPGGEPEPEQEPETEPEAAPQPETLPEPEREPEPEPEPEAEPESDPEPESEPQPEPQPVPT
jgi:hypothetical protein